MRYVVFIIFLTSYVFASYKLSDFDKYQNQKTQSALEERIKSFIKKDEAVESYYSFVDNQLHIYDAEFKLEYNLKLFAEAMSLAEEIQPPFKQKIKIALDPGHFGGKYSKQEERHFLQLPVEVNNYKKLLVKEGDINFYTAINLKKKLEAIGVEVLLTRGAIAQSSFGLSYEQWFKFKRTDYFREALSIYPEGKEKEIERKRLENLTIKNAFSDFVRADLYERVKKINAFKPDLAISIHFNSCGVKRRDGYYIPSKDNFTMAFVPGALEGEYFKYKNYRYHFLRMLLTDHIDRSIPVAKYLVEEFNKNLNIEIVDPEKHIAPYIKNYSIYHSPGVYSRGLMMTREIQAPSILGEPSCADNAEEAMELEHSHVSETSPRIEAVSTSYFNAIVRGF